MAGLRSAIKGGETRIPCPWRDPMDDFPSRRLGGEFEPSQGRCRDVVARLRVATNKPVARRLRIIAFDKLAGSRSSAAGAGSDPRRAAGQRLQRQGLDLTFSQRGGLRKGR